MHHDQRCGWCVAGQLGVSLGAPLTESPMLLISLAYSVSTAHRAERRSSAELRWHAHEGLFTTSGGLSRSEFVDNARRVRRRKCERAARAGCLSARKPETGLARRAQGRRLQDMFRCCARGVGSEPEGRPSARSLARGSAGAARGRAHLRCVCDAWRASSRFSASC